MKWTMALLVCVVIIPSAVRAQPGPVRVFEDTVDVVSEYLVILTPNATVTFETVNISGGGDPVLHLWDLGADRELAFDDNGAGGRAARLTYTPTAAAFALVIVRPRAVWSKGRCDITLDGQTWRSGARFGGWMLPLLNLELNENIVVVSPPAGPKHHRQYVFSEDGLHLDARRSGALRTLWTVPPGSSTFRTLLMGVSAPVPPVIGVIGMEGPPADDGLSVHGRALRPLDGRVRTGVGSGDVGRRLRLLRNDARLTGRDPDADGVGRELERQLGTCSTKTDLVGAFDCSTAADLRDTDGDGIQDGWEILGHDWRDRSGGEAAYVALPHFGADPRHKDLFIEVDYRRLTEEQNAAGDSRYMPPEVARELASIYGDDETTHPLVRAFHGRLLGNPDLEPGIRVHLDTGLEPGMEADASIYGNWGGYDVIDAVQTANGDWVGQPPGALWRTRMHPSRYGIFKYGPGHWGGGGKCGAGVACGYNMRSSAVAAHEMGHSFGLDHVAPMGVTTREANCKPNYPSLMSYAYVGEGRFSDGQDRPPLNNVSLREWQAVPTWNQQYVEDLKTIFMYTVDLQNGHVDWNLDGVFAPAGETVRAYANNQPGSDCELTRMNEHQISGAATHASVALTRFNDETWVFWVDPSGAVRYAKSASAWTCSPATSGCSGSSFGSPQSAGFPVTALGVDAESATFQGRSHLAVVITGTDRALWHRFAIRQPNGSIAWTTATQIPGEPVAGEPSLAGVRLGSGLYLAYKDVDHLVRWRIYNGTAWEDEILAQTPDGTYLATSPAASPAIAHVYLPWQVPEQPMLYGAFTRPNGSLAIYWLNFAGRWVNTSLLDDPLTPVVGRPTMAWVPDSKSADDPGILYLGARRGDDGDYWMQRTYVGFLNGPTRIGRAAFFDNSWYQGAALDFMGSDAGAFPQLWSVTAFGAQGAIYLRPRADGLSDFPYHNYDDWSALAWGLCRYTVNPDGSQSDPVECMDRPW